jgi:hypothetical protein
MLSNANIFVIGFILITLTFINSKTLSINEISWSDYVINLKGSTIDLYSYRTFKESTIKIIEHNKENQKQWGVTTFLHISTDEFSKRFVNTNNLVPSEFHYRVTTADIIFSQLPSNKYFSWIDKNIIGDATDDIIIWPHVISSFIEIYYKIISNIRFSIDTININSCYSSIYDALESMTKSNILLSDYSRTDSKCISMIIHNLRNHGYIYQEIKMIESRSLPFIEKVTGNIDIYYSPMIIEISVDFVEDLQYYSGSILTLNSHEKYPNFSAIIVGFGKDGILPYWIVRANFGNNWGLEGNFKLNPQSSGIKYIYQI